jgi:hypothetical protein
MNLISIVPFSARSPRITNYLKTRAICSEIRNTRADHAAKHMRLANRGGNLQLISSVLEAARPDRSIVDHARISDGKRGRIYMGVAPADRAPVARVRRSTPRLKSLAEICLFLTDRCIHLLRVCSICRS